MAAIIVVIFHFLLITLSLIENIFKCMEQTCYLDCLLSIRIKQVFMIVRSFYDKRDARRVLSYTLFNCIGI